MARTFASDVSGLAIVVLVATTPATRRDSTSDRMSSSASNERSGATLIRIGFGGPAVGLVGLEVWIDCRAARISSNAALSWSCRRLGVFGELTLTTKKSAYGLNTRKDRA